ncbi:MAG: hypothetical protein VX392_05025 [Verrucomicrobiota bacterium]|nr:hypothetical protein [Verrucomicrobiota bacterium]
MRLATTTHFELNRMVISPLGFTGFEIETPNYFVLFLPCMKVDEPLSDNRRAVSIANGHSPN